jgi:hypothetical protein
MERDSPVDTGFRGVPALVANCKRAQNRFRQSTQFVQLVVIQIWRWVSECLSVGRMTDCSDGHIRTSPH